MATICRRSLRGMAMAKKSCGPWNFNVLDLLQLHECLLREGDAEALDADAFTPREAMAPTPVQEVRQQLISRDRTAQFNLRRAGNRRKNCIRKESADSENIHLLESELQEVFQLGACINNSLASKLAQHNGLKQFGLENRNRVPPLEFRVMLPELEKGIQADLEMLMSLRTRLDMLDIQTSHCKAHEHKTLQEADFWKKCMDAEDKVRPLRLPGIRRHLCTWLQTIHKEAQTSYLAQQEEMTALAKSSPQFSPMLCPLGKLGGKLAKVLSSPPGSRQASPQSVCTEPTRDLWSSPESACTGSVEDRSHELESGLGTRESLLRSSSAVRTLDLDAELSDEGEKESPFSSLFGHFTKDDGSARLGKGGRLPPVPSFSLIVQDGEDFQSEEEC